ncbi:hypothetical protein [Egicoccus halophilus]|uniref:Tripartite tricarboxylate transporter TctB family protein n=1 Tax=Egicoccus halophilus TaxID=1670830 RepID=A0A8J3A7A1_9ACTN|nr:hypothetical protein [Egicoccus halophilus]GGI02389.1 hypothetical protein GCM10011354_00190 [Egicoccus halophilus]
MAHGDKRDAAQAVVLWALLLLFILAGLQAGGFRSQSRPLPLFLGGSGVFVTSTLLIGRGMQWWRRRPIRDVPGREATADHIDISGVAHEPGPPGGQSDEGTDPLSSGELGASLAYWGVFAGYLLMIFLVGFHLASFGFVAGFLLLRGELRWPFAIAGAGALVVVFVTLERLYNLRLPAAFWA